MTLNSVLNFIFLTIFGYIDKNKTFCIINIIIIFSFIILFFDNLGDDGFKEISSCVHKINSRKIGNSNDQNLTIIRIKSFCEAIRNSLNDVSQVLFCIITVYVSSKLRGHVVGQEPLRSSLLSFCCALHKY